MPAGARLPFKDSTFLREALTHASGANHRLASNERLEFLGDAILGAIVCELLFRKFPDYLEGELTRIKSVVVSRRTCAKISRALGLDDFLVLGKGMGSQDETPSSVLADVFESLIGAIYLDGGMEAAQRFIVRHIEAEIDAAVDGQGGLNYKSNLQQVAQRSSARPPPTCCSTRRAPTTRSASRSRPRSAGSGIAPAWGRNKKDAEQRAAMNALCQLGGRTRPLRVGLTTDRTGDDRARASRAPAWCNGA